MNFEYAAGAFAIGIPVDPALAAANGPAAFAGPAGEPVAAEETGDATPFQVEDRQAAVFQRRTHRAKDARAGGDADDRPPDDVQHRIEEVAGQPTEEARAAGLWIEQVMVRSAARDVAGDEGHLQADQLAEGPLLHHPLQATHDVV